MEKHYNFIQIEKQMQDFWEEKQIYKFDISRGGDLYSIDTPPPTISGSPHIGHLFSYTQAEMIGRFRRMQGNNVFYPFGFDNNGLPTERLVESIENIRGKDLPRSEFIEKCKTTSKNYELTFKDFWKSLGFSVDWSMQYETINEDVQKISQELFLELVKKEKAYMKKTPVLWCTECQTSIAQADLDTTNTESAFVHIPFIVDAKPLIVATTRPELLYGCVCLFINPKDERYQNYIGKSALVPLYNYEIPIMADDKVDIDKGTGVVMCATFGDTIDAEWFNIYGLPYREVILSDGTIKTDIPFIGGLKTREAREEIIRLLDEASLLIDLEQIYHVTPVHERCGKEIEIIPSWQWYIDILSEKEEFIKAADKINWYPTHMKNRYIAWVENLKWDWCISRQRYFGVPFPVWYCKRCGQPVYASLKQLPVNPLETKHQGTCSCGCNEFIPESAVFDTWVTSSITPQINERLGYKLMPMGMRNHAHEIIRTWTFYTIVRSLYHTGDIPWKDLMISGFVLAKKGEKISKSKANAALEPRALIHTHSADVLRYWSANAKLGTDTFFSANELSIGKRFITKLWNASKFAISHLQDIKLLEVPQLLPIDQWMIEKTNQVIKTVTSLLNEYEIGLARHEIDELFWKDFCDNYIEIIKSRLYQPEIHGYNERGSGQYALYYSLLNILKMYAIYTPHITEYIYQKFFRRHEETISIHLLQWEKPERINQDIIRFGKCAKDLISDVRKYKTENSLSMKAEMDILEVRCDLKFTNWFLQTEKDLKACTNAKEIKYNN